MRMPTRFQLRTLFCTFIVIGLGFGVIGNVLRLAKIQASIVEDIRKHGGHVRYGHDDVEIGWSRDMLIKLFGIDAVVPVTAVKVMGPSVDNALVRRICKLKKIEDLFIDEAHNVSDSGVSNLHSLHRLSFLRIDSRQITDDAISDILKARQLKELVVLSPNITDMSVERLSRQSQLEWLLVAGSISPTGMKTLRNSMTNCDVKIIDYYDQE